MPVEYDIVIETANRTRVLVAECKRMKVTSATEAANLRHSLQVLTRDPTSSYFMLVVPTALFLWTENADARAEPQFSVAAKPVLKRYLGDIADLPGGPLSESLEMAIYSWLNALACGIRTPDLDSEPERAVVESGLFDKLKGAIVRLHVAA